jgi:CheY-like chemotaxis protein
MVEDNEANRDMPGRRLERQGYRIYLIAEAQSAHGQAQFEDDFSMMRIEFQAWANAPPLPRSTASSAAYFTTGLSTILRYSMPVWSPCR